MLNLEGVTFGERLGGPGIGKNMHGGLIKESVHAFDRKPNPIRFPGSGDRCYAEGFAERRRVFGGDGLNGAEAAGGVEEGDAVSGLRGGGDGDGPFADGNALK